MSSKSVDSPQTEGDYDSDNDIEVHQSHEDKIKETSKRLIELEKEITNIKDCINKKQEAKDCSPEKYNEDNKKRLKILISSLDTTRNELIKLKSQRLGDSDRGYVGNYSPLTKSTKSTGSYKPSDDDDDDSFVPPLSKFVPGKNLLNRGGGKKMRNKTKCYARVSNKKMRRKTKYNKISNKKRKNQRRNSKKH